MSFGTVEYQERIWKTKERMAAKGIEVLLITDPAKMNCLAGYDIRIRTFSQIRRIQWISSLIF